MYAQAKSCPHPAADRSAPSPGRLLALTLGFAAAAVTAYSLTPLLPAARYTLTAAPALALPEAVQALAMPLPAAALSLVLGLLGLLRGVVCELLLWGLAAVIPACPLLPMLLSLRRGGCFGVVLAMVTSDTFGQAALAGVTPPALVCPLLCTAVLFGLAAAPLEKSEGWGSFIRRFLVTSGGVFALTLAGAVLPWLGEKL